MAKEIARIVCSCSSVIVKSIGNSYKIRSKVIVVENNKAMAVCKGCGQNIEIPIKFDLSSLNPPLIIVK